MFDQDLLDRSNPEAAFIALSAGATDPDSDTPSYSANGLPLGLTIDSGTGMISGVVNHAAAASSPYNVEISVTDGINPAVTDTFTWTITNVATTDPYLVAGSGGSGGGDDLLTTVDEANFVPATNEVDIGTGTGTSGIEAAAIEPNTGTLFAIDGGQLGTLDVDNGTFSPVGSGIGTGDGEFGLITFDNITGMTFHPLTGEIWAVHQRPGLTDVMVRVDPTTGAFIPNVFTGNQDYLKLRTLGAATDFTALTIDPTDWQLYGHITNGGGTDHVVEIHRRNGNVKDVGATASELTDLSFDASGQLWGIDAGALYAVDKTSAALDAGRAIDNGSAYGAVAFQVPPADPPAFEGTVFEDIAGDGLSGTQFVNDSANPGAAGVTVHLYQDNGSVAGEPDATDTLVDTKITGPTGKYFFEGLPVSGFYVVVDSASVDPAAGGSGWAEQTYGAAGSATFTGSYSYAVSAGSLYGGMQPTVSDDATSLTSSEHVIWLDLVRAVTFTEPSLSAEITSNRWTSASRSTSSPTSKAETSPALRDRCGSSSPTPMG